MPSTVELLDVEQVAAIVGVHPRTIERCIAATTTKGAVRPFPGWKRLGKKKLITRAALEAWIADLPDA